MVALPIDPVTSAFGLRLLVADADPLDVHASLRYTAEDPYAVQVTFRAGGPKGEESVEWTFARQLLTDGVTQPAGEGDVKVWPADATAGDSAPIICLALTSPSGRALFEVPLTELVEFLTRTYALVPTGCESDYIDVESELADLLGDEIY